MNGVPKPFHNSLYTFLIACLCLAGSSPAGEFQATGPSSIAAIAAGKGAEFLSAMESTASKAENNAAASSSPGQYWAEASAAYGEASWAARSIGQLQKSLSYAERALETADKAKDPMLQARAIYRLTAVHSALRQPMKVTLWAERGLKTTPQIQPGPGREALEGEFYRLLGLDALRAEDVAKAVELLSHSLRIQESRMAFFESARRLGPAGSQALSAARHHVLYSLNNLGAAYRSAGRPDEAMRTYEKGIALLKRTGVKTNAEGNLYHGLGEVYLGQKNYPRALENLRAALSIGERQREDPVIYAANKHLGDLHRETRSPGDAMAHYRKAVETVEATRSLLQSEESRQSFFAGRLDAYVGMVGALFDFGRFEDAFNYSERARARVFLDLVGSKAQLSRNKTGLLEEEMSLQARIAALRARLSSEAGAAAPDLGKELAEAEAAYEAFLAKVRREDKEQASLMAVEPLQPSEVQQLLDPGTTLIEYFVTESEVLIWVVEKNKIHALKRPLAKNDLSVMIKTLRETIPIPGEREKLDQLSMSLHAQLIEPVLPQVTGKELVIVPHDVLHYLPFHALRSREGAYLIERYPVAYLSSASLLQFVRAKRKAKGEKVLALGNPDLGDFSMNLRFAEREAREIQRLYPGSTVLVREEATEEKGKSLSPPYDIVHFATHAELTEDNPLSTAILLASGGKEDGRLEVKEIFQMDLKAGLVVLSACETGLGKLSTGDELVGLTRAFIYAGTPTVVASLWKVQDMSTTELMSAFYKNLRTMSKVEALRRAQLGLIRNQDAAGSQATSHPYFWAPFVLIGDGS
jgi:CHAT domain-containing protein